MNQDALVERVSKGAGELPDDFLAAQSPNRSLFAAPRPAPVPAAVPFTPLAEAAKAVERRLAAFDLAALFQKAIEEVDERSRAGRPRRGAGERNERPVSWAISARSPRVAP